MATIDYIILWLLWVLWFSIFLMIIEMFLQIKDIKKEHKEIQEEKKLEELRKILWPDYKINIRVWWSNRYSYYITKWSKRIRNRWEICYTLWELEKVVATIKSFSL